MTHIYTLPPSFFDEWDEGERRMKRIRALDDECTRLIAEARDEACGRMEPSQQLVLLDPPRPFDLLYGGTPGGGMAG